MKEAMQFLALFGAATASCLAACGWGLDMFTPAQVVVVVVSTSVVAFAATNL